MSFTIKASISKVAKKIKNDFLFEYKGILQGTVHEDPNATYCCNDYAWEIRLD